MKGQKNYNLAQIIRKEMYLRSHSFEEQKKLHRRYFDLIKKAAYQGHVESMYDMGNEYDDIGYLGIPNPFYNIKKCFYWYSKACQKGHAEACNNLSVFYALGEGCKQDFSYALELLKRSGELGSVLGKRNYKMKLRDLEKTGKYLLSSR